MDLRVGTTRLSITGPASQPNPEIPKQARLPAKRKAQRPSLQHTYSRNGLPPYVRPRTDFAVDQNANHPLTTPKRKTYRYPGVSGFEGWERSPMNHESDLPTQPGNPETCPPTCKERSRTPDRFGRKSVVPAIGNGLPTAKPPRSPAGELP